MARIPRKAEVPSTLTLSVEVKEPTEDEMTVAAGYLWGDKPPWKIYPYINTAPL